MLDNILSLLPIILAVVVVLAIILTGYVKAPPDQAYIISGLKKGRQDPHRPGRHQNSLL